MTTTYAPVVAGVVGSPLLQELDLPTRLKAQRRAGPLPGMSSNADRALLHELAHRTWRGDGVIIDGGSFFGASLVASATGLERNPQVSMMDFGRFPAGKPIHGFERGYLPAPANDSADRRRVYGSIEYLLGESFVPILEDNIAPHRELVQLHIEDLIEQTWDGSPIEIAFIDVCKTIGLNSHVSRQFLPAMIGGASTLINQDFFFDRLPWIKVTMGYLGEYFQWEGQVFTSAVFSSLKPVPPDVADLDPFTEGTYEECLALHDAVEFPGIDRKTEFSLALSRSNLMALKNRKEQAMEYLRAVTDEYDDLLDDTDNPRGSRFRLDRAVRQIGNGNIFKMS